MIFRRSKERKRLEQDRLEKAKEYQRQADEQKKQAESLTQRAEQVQKEAASIRDENHFADMYLTIFRGEDPPRRRKRGGPLPWPHG